MTDSISWQQYRKLLEKPKRKAHKYGAKKTLVGEHSFPSQLEADTWLHLQTLQRGGLIRELKRHDSIQLVEGFRYKPDFRAVEVEKGESVWYEAKGAVTDRWRIVRRMWKIHGPGPLHVYKSGSRGVYLAEVIVPDRCK